MTKGKRTGKKPEADNRTPSTRFVTRRRPSRRRKPAGNDAFGARPTDATNAPIEEYPAFGADQAPRSGRAPRPAEPPPRNPNIFSYTYRVWKNS